MYVQTDVWMQRHVCLLAASTAGDACQINRQISRPEVLLDMEMACFKEPSGPQWWNMAP
jgi:hypothetical protein